MRFRRLRRWWPALIVLALALIAYAAWPGKSTLTVSPETTYVTDPVDAQGYVDYPAALNERLGKGIAPETNANVLIVRALGPHPEGGTMPPDFYRLLSIESPPEEGEYFLDSDKYFKAHVSNPADDVLGLFEGEPDLRRDWDDVLGLFEGEFDLRKDWDDRQSRARSWPWKAADEPAIADWLRRNEKPLAVAVEATRRPHYFNPLVSKSTEPQSARLISSLLPTVQKCRAIANAITARAMMRAGAGDVDGAWQDLLACQRLGRLVGRGGTLIESLVGIAVVTMATNYEVTLLGHAKPSSQQALIWLEDLRRLPPFPSLADKLDLCERFVMLDTLTSVVVNGPEFLEKLDGPSASPLPGRAYRQRLFTRSIDWDPAFRNANRMFDRCAAAARLPDRATRTLEFGKIEDEIKQTKAAMGSTNGLERALMGKAQRGEFIGNVLLSLFLPAMGKIQDAQDRLEQSQHNLHVAFALAAFRADTGRYPARLDELTPKYLKAIPDDLFAGKPLTYLPTADGYLLYSVGINGKDEDGHWTNDEPRGDDLRVRMPASPPK